MTDKWERCDPGCEGYFASNTDGGLGHAFVEIQSCHDCARFIDDGMPADYKAHSQFVRDLEDGNRDADRPREHQYAIEQLANLLTSDDMDSLQGIYERTAK